ncbi:MAG TPA: c-type cytochrome [Vicinamibacterales bacterium]|nr:c-type cytochrome [Vicinamibacterales bacterium]
MRIQLFAVPFVLALAAIHASGVSAQKPAPNPKPSAARAKALENYERTCQPCHGPEGKSPLPNMSLADGEWKHGSSLAAIAKTITDGVPGTPMLPNKDKFTKAEIQELARLVRSFDPKLAASPK